MRSLFILSLIIVIATVASAFTATTSIHSPSKARRCLIGSKSCVRKTTFLSAAAAGGGAKKKKKTTKKKKATKKKSKAADPVEEDEEVQEVVTFRKPEFVSRIAEKTGMSKSDSEAALSAVLETITEVSSTI